MAFIPPVPIYLDIAYVQLLLGSKVSIADGYPDAMPILLANSLIASAESEVIEEFLNHFQFPTPTEFVAMITTYPTTYAALAGLLGTRATLWILREYYGDVGESKGDEFIAKAEKQYAFWTYRLLRKLDNGLYAYLNMPGLSINPLATINKVYRHSWTGFIGGQRQIMADYAQNQTLDPQQSFNLSWGHNGPYYEPFFP
jgi:hypothetical protein